MVVCPLSPSASLPFSSPSFPSSRLPLPPILLLINPLPIISSEANLSPDDAEENIGDIGDIDADEADGIPRVEIGFGGDDGDLGIQMPRAVHLW